MTKRSSGRPANSIEDSYDPSGIKTKYAKEKQIGIIPQNILCSIAKFEKQYDRYCFDFSDVQMLNYLKSLDTHSYYVMCIYHIDNFIKWYHEIYKTDQVNLLQDISTKYGVDEYISQKEIEQRCIINREYLYDIVSEICNNGREKIVIILLYEGLNKTEIVNLKIGDCDFENNLIKVNLKRILNIHSKSKEKIIEALREKSYDNPNVNRKFSYLSERNEYIFKVTNTNTKHENKNREDRLERDLRKVSERLHNQSKFAYKVLKARYLNKSGFLDYLMSLEEKKISLTKEIYLKALIRYNLISSKNIKSTTLKSYELLYNTYKNYINKLNLENRTQYTLEYEENIQQELTKKANPRKKNGQDNFISKWAGQNAEKGANGEKLLLSLMQNFYKVGDDSIYKVLDYYGYDLYFDLADCVEYIEVKTMNSLRSTFYISINELRSANFYTEQYYLYLVIWNENENEYSEIYRIPDPISFLSLSNSILKPYWGKELVECETDSCSFFIKDIGIKLNENIIENINKFLFYKNTEKQSDDLNI